MSEKIGPVGGNNGVAFDDGVFDGVKKITVGNDIDCVSYIKIEYEKDGEFVTIEHGTIHGELNEFAVDYPKESITSVGGSYDYVSRYNTVLITSLIFKTSFGRTSPMFGYSYGEEFMLKGKNGGKLIGFYGRSGQAIDAIGAYFSLVPEPEKTVVVGGNNGDAFDDGVFHGVKKITVGKDIDCVSYIKIEYEKDGEFETCEHGTIRGELEEFDVDYPNENIIAVGGSYDYVNRYKTILIQSLFFKTSFGRTSPIFGASPSGTEFMLEGTNGGKLLGFHGRSGQAIDAVGAYFWSIPAPASEKIEEVGGINGDAFDDGVFHGVKKITVGKDIDCVSYIKIEYEKDGEFETREHGTIRGELEEFDVDYPNENIIAVGGSYDYVNRYKTILIQSLFFKTSFGRTSPIFGASPSGTEFMLEGTNGGKLLGFHGRSGQAIDAVGAYFWSIPAPASEKIEEVGGINGDAFDDGVFHGVKKITVGKDIDCVSYIKIEYEKDGEFETREHGTIRGELEEFDVDYPNENIISVGGSYDYVNRYKTILIKSLFFKTSFGRTSPIFGASPSGTEFLLEGTNGGKLIGFHGRSGQAIDAIGAYFWSIPAPQKIEAVGGNGGVVFDDGVFDGVKKITVGKDIDCVSYIKIEYEKDGEFETFEHGTIRGELKEFDVDYPNECITSVGGSYDHVIRYNTVLIKSLIFKTSYGRTSPTFGETDSNGKPVGKEFIFEGKYGKNLLGFHGRSGQAIDAIGVYFGAGGN
ncbi:PREDICTED: myrosinase-binding protein 2-like [Camelina sativa]|uniref:Myrosinase-binding protein 2-like n=1 Tax=Camelina sativa TaxID=90675 RepID=A0ABM0VE47_CAMSA|nr:PREDICTED: myrosinase-binding protein 2-like [Camelina sativa]